VKEIPSYVSAALAVIVSIGLIVLIALGISVPGELWSAFGVVIGFFFGTNTNSLKT